MTLTKSGSITPGFLFRTTEGTPPEVIIQSWAGRQINEEFKLNFGAAYRFSDAAQVLGRSRLPGGYSRCPEL